MRSAAETTMTRAKVFATAELAWLGMLFWIAIWAPAWTGVRGWSIAAFLLFFATIAVSLAYRRPPLKESGLRLDNILPAIKHTAILAGAAVICLWLGTGVLPPSPWTSPARLLQYIGFGVFQQTLMLGYFFQRWQILLPLPAAAVANALCFALLHLPDVVLAGIAGAGEVIFTWLFLRARNVVVLGIAHGVLSLVVLPFLLDASVMQTPRIGPAPLRAIVTAGPRTEAVAICSKVIAPDQLGALPGRGIERILRGQSDDAAIRRSLAAFLRQDRTVLCIITEREFHRYLEPAQRAALFVVAERFIWRSPRNTPTLFEADPILGVFRDRVLLVANRPLG
jgi:membrane protease YdiL (CAAX protease family)